MRKVRRSENMDAGSTALSQSMVSVLQAEDVPNDPGWEGIKISHNICDNSHLNKSRWPSL